MQIYEWNRVEKEQLSPTLVRQVIHGGAMTVARLYLRKGSSAPEHSHHNEQISMIEQGSLKFVIAGRETVVKAGQVLRIPPNFPHSAGAMEAAVSADLFCAPTEVW